jgi:hypothetical protein
VACDASEGVGLVAGAGYASQAAKRPVGWQSTKIAFVLRAQAVIYSALEYHGYALWMEPGEFSTARWWPGG